jgi:hypothetical protein
VEGVNSSMIHLICFKNFSKCHNVPLPNTTIKTKLQKQQNIVQMSNKRRLDQSDSGGSSKKVLCLRYIIRSQAMSFAHVPVVGFKTHQGFLRGFD